MAALPDDTLSSPLRCLRQERQGRPWVRYCAGFWSLVLFLPVGMTYLAFFVLALGLAADLSLPWQHAHRWRPLRAQGMFAPLLAFAAWTLLVLAWQPVVYPETRSNLWHGARIVLTFMMASVLTRDEALWALRGFLVAAAVSMLVVALGPAIGPALDSPLRNLLQYSGNKSISNALLLALACGSAVVMALACTGRARLVASLAAVALLCAILFALPSRSALLIALLSVPAAALHQWRDRWRRLALVGVAMAIATGLLLVLVPAMQARLAQGVAELRQAGQGDVTQGSWNLRAQMARHTIDMVRDKPLRGWGIGAWNDQWRRRAPAAIAYLNMPHDDLLWMGAQAGVPGALAWLAVMLAACRIGWRRRDPTGRLAFVAALALLGAGLVNSATRDAAIGLCLPWITAVCVRLAEEPPGRSDPRGAMPWART